MASSKTSPPDMEDKMLQLIKQHRQNELLGSTREGRDFCLRALHPAAEKIDSPGIPDEFSGNVSIMKYNQVSMFDYATAFPSGTATTWDVEILLYKNPAILGCAKLTSAGVSQFVPICNTSIVPLGTNSTLASRYALGFTACADSYRCVYSSCTGHLDAPATASQGTIVAAQYQDMPMSLNHSFFLTDTVQKAQISTIAQVYKQYRGYDSLMIMPGAYCSPAIDGVYMPLVLDDFAFKVPVPMIQYDYTVYNGLLTQLKGDYPVFSNPVYNVAFPYGSTSCITTSSATNAVLALPRSGESVGHIFFKGISTSAKVVLTLRNGYEVQLPPANQFNMFQRISPRVDLMALQAYQIVRRELLAAYPESYNSLGALISTIGSIAATYIPQLISWIQKKREERKERNIMKAQAVVRSRPLPPTPAPPKHVPPKKPPPAAPKLKKQ